MVVHYLSRPDGLKLAYDALPRAAGNTLPTLLFLGGYRSDRGGTKALFLEDQCRARGQAFVRFDYSGHGDSEGRFEDGTIGRWKEDARLVLDKLTQGPVVLVGSSMGGWIALLLARECPERIAGLVGIAAAPDFTKDVEAALGEAERALLDRAGYVEIPNGYDDGVHHMSRAFLNDGRQNSFFGQKAVLPFPVRLIQGMKDNQVPWRTAQRIKDHITGAVEIVLVEEGGHRLSEPDELALIGEQIRFVQAR